MKKKLVLMTSALMAISLLSACNQHTHDWGEVTYTWSSDNLTCTAERVCKSDESHKETETVNTTYVVVDAAKCEEDGKGRFTADFKTNEAFVDQTKDIVLEATGHTLVAHVAKGETCTEVGNTAYWSCENCDKYFSDENGEHEIAADSWVIQVHAHTLTHHDAVAESCETNGNVEYWTCSECNQYFLDEAGTQVSSAEGIVIAAHHTLTHHDKQPETCTSNGMIEYWHCSVCDKDFYDADATREIEGEDDYIILAHHTLTHHNAKEETCTEDGHIEHWTCDVCGKYFTDAEAENEVAASVVTIAKKGHSWGEPTYEWNADHTECTATRVCANDASHVETETASITVGMITDEDGDNPGTAGRAAIFENKAFAPQTTNKNIFEFKKNSDGVSYSLTKFYDDTSSEPIVLPTTINELPVTKIGRSCFYYCDHITSMVIPEGIVSIDDEAFRMVNYMTSIVFPSTLTSIGFESFSNCKSLTSINLNEGLREVGLGAFYYCKVATTLNLPSTITTLGDVCFGSCIAMTTINYAGTKEQWANVTKGDRWHEDVLATVVHCSDGDVAL